MTKIYENILYEGRVRNFFYDTTIKRQIEGGLMEKVNVYVSQDGECLVDEQTLIKLDEEQRQNKLGGDYGLEEFL